MALPHRNMLIVLSMAVAGCSGGDKDSGKGGPPQVGFITVQQTSVTQPVELSGRTTAWRTAEVRPQVSGVVERRLFTEGALVHQGQPLYRIDPRLYRAATAQAAANLASAQANAESTGAKADRYRPLAADRAVAAQDYTDAAAAAKVARASVAQNNAALRTAQINLHFTTVPAPITGRIGRSLFTEGALVTADQAGPLAVISALDPIYVDIQQSAEDVLKLRRQMAGGAGQSAFVHLILDDGSAYPQLGILEFSEVTVDPDTSTVTLRARFPNSQGLLLPGLFVRTLLDQKSLPNVYLVPQAAVTRDARGNAQVFVLEQLPPAQQGGGAGKDGTGPDSAGKATAKAVLRAVTVASAHGAFWVVTSGLKPGERVITQGLGKIRPGQAVRAVPDSSPQEPGAKRSDQKGQKPGQNSGAGQSHSAAKPG